MVVNGEKYGKITDTSVSSDDEHEDEYVKVPTVNCSNVLISYVFL